MEANKNKVIKSIAIAGAGGIGGYVCKMLFNIGFERVKPQFPFNQTQIDVFDDDTVDTKNLLHQDFSEADLGNQKSQIMSDRYMINPVKRFMTVEDFPKYDVIFSCVDSMTFRKQLYEYGWANPGKVFWIDGRCNSRTIGLYTSDMGRKSIEGDVTDSKERKGCLREVDKANDVSHVTPVVIAGMMTQAFLNHIRGEKNTEKLVLMI